MLHEAPDERDDQAGEYAHGDPNDPHAHPEAFGEERDQQRIGREYPAAAGEEERVELTEQRIEIDERPDAKRNDDSDHGKWGREHDPAGKLPSSAHDEQDDPCGSEDQAQDDHDARGGEHGDAVFQVIHRACG